MSIRAELLVYPANERRLIIPFYAENKTDAQLF